MCLGMWSERRKSYGVDAGLEDCTLFFNGFECGILDRCWDWNRGEHDCIIRCCFRTRCWHVEYGVWWMRVLRVCLLRESNASDLRAIVIYVVALPLFSYISPTATYRHFQEYLRQPSWDRTSTISCGPVLWDIAESRHWWGDYTMQTYSHHWTDVFNPRCCGPLETQSILETSDI